MKAITTKSLFLSVLSILVAGCVAGDNITDDDEPEPEPTPEPSPEGEVAPVKPVLYAKTCLDIVAAHPDAVDGEHTLYIDSDPEKSWKAYCHDMAANPTEYLTLPIGANKNFSQYTAGGFSPGTSVRTTYVRVRIDPMTLAIDIHDQRFAVSTGALTHSTTPVSSMPFGVAMSCSGSPGLANIDLSGTQFAIADTFVVSGFQAIGNSLQTADNRTISIEGRGSCGWNAVEGAPFNPMNSGAAKFALSLRYAK